MLERLFAFIWASWIDEGWQVEKVKSWNTARLRHKIGTKQTLTIELFRSWQKGWRPWK